MSTPYTPPGADPTGYPGPRPINPPSSGEAEEKNEDDRKPFDSPQEDDL